MLKLYASLTSPFARKVRIVLTEKKVEHEFVLENAWDPASKVHEVNPLNKVPVLVLDDGSAIYDSAVIVDYLDTITPVRRLVPGRNRERIAVKRLEALCDGICEAAANVFLERKRPPEKQSQDWINRQLLKVIAGLKALSHDLGERDWFAGDSFGLADIAAGCALFYIDFRFPEIKWRESYPNLVRFADKLAKRPSFAATVPPAL